MQRNRNSLIRLVATCVMVASLIGVNVGYAVSTLDARGRQAGSVSDVAPPATVWTPETTASTSPSPNRAGWSTEWKAVTLVGLAAPASQARPASLAPATMEGLVYQSFLPRFGPVTAAKAVRVARCESRLKPTALNGTQTGLFQLLRRWQIARARRLGFTWDKMFLARPNIAVAMDLLAEQGWRPWPICGRR